MLHTAMSLHIFSIILVDHILSINNKTEFTIKNTMLGKQSWNKFRFASHL